MLLSGLCNTLRRRNNANVPPQAQYRCCRTTFTGRNDSCRSSCLPTIFEYIILLKTEIQQPFSLSVICLSVCKHPFKVRRLGCTCATKPPAPTWLPSVLMFSWLENWVLLCQLELLHEREWRKNSFPLLMGTCTSLYTNGFKRYDTMEIGKVLLSRYQISCVLTW